MPEYLVLRLGDGAEAITAELNRYAEEGWRVVNLAAIPYVPDKAWVLLVREAGGISQGGD
jgi:hypothetical protein